VNRQFDEGAIFRARRNRARHGRRRASSATLLPVRDRWAAIAFVSALVSCGSAPPPQPAAPPPLVAAEPEAPDVAVAADEPPPPPIATTDAADRAHAPSSASYDEALSTPELVDIEDDHPHLTDVQLWSPIRGALSGCRVPRNAKVTIKAAVQFGRAIGVTVDVRLDKPRSLKHPPKPAAVKAERKTIARIAACVDHNVRASVWPPNRRRDSFTTEL
jgi:hypothetical protein